MYKKSLIKLANIYFEHYTAVGTDDILVTKNLLFLSWSKQDRALFLKFLKCIGITLEDLLKHRLFGPSKELWFSSFGEGFEVCFLTNFQVMLMVASEDHIWVAVLCMLLKSLKSKQFYYSCFTEETAAQRG